MAVHILKSIRDAINTTLDAAVIEIDVNGTLTPVLRLNSPPSGSMIDEAELPAFFVFIQGETIEPDTYKSYRRTLRPVIYMYAKSSGDPQDQLDELQLKIEIALDGNKTLGGIVYEFMPVAMAAHQDQGRVVFGGRSLEYRCVTSVTSNNPTI
ncbi:MAG: hypothetical protein COA84_15115 [Robiginitomaculum sp.]|nr:MAG: hypothetical protein COA84_15115 [Robiginitomaculum sp.]